MSLITRPVAAARAMWRELRAQDKPAPDFGGDRAELAFADPQRLFPESVAYNPSVLATRKGLGIFEEMRKDEQVKAALAFKKHAILAPGWEIVSPEGQPDDWEPTLFARWVLDNVECTVEGLLLQVMTALDFGYSVNESVFADIESGDFAGKIRLATVKGKRPHDFTFDVDQFGNLKDDGIIQANRPDAGSFGSDGARLPAAKFVRMVYQPEFGNPYGTSDLEATYRAWWMKDNSYKWLGMLLERYGIPPIFALYDGDALNAAQVDQLKTVLTRIQAATAGVIPRSNPESLEMWSPQLAGQVSTVFLPAIDNFDNAIARSLLMPGMLGVTPDKLGSFARAKVVFDVFLFTVNFIQQCLATSIVGEQIIHPLIQMNFGIEEHPVFRFKPLTQDVQTELLGTWANMLRVGAAEVGEDDEAHIRRLIDFPVRDIDAERKPNNREIFAYHLKNGLLTVNEVRELLNLPPVPWGNERVGEFLTDQSVAASEAIGVEGPAGHETPKPPGRDGGDDETPKSEQDPEEAAAEDDGEDKGDGSDKPATLAQFAEGDVSRGLTEAEQRVDFAALAETLDGIEDAFIADMTAAFVDARDRLTAKIRKDGDLSAKMIREIEVKLPRSAKVAGRTFLRDIFAFGRATLRAEVSRVHSFREEPDYEPTAALRFLDAQSDFFVSHMNDDATKAVRASLLTSFKAGLHNTEIIKRLRDALVPWAGDPVAVRDTAQLRPDRIETIARTNATQSFNQGRLVEARDPEVIQFVQGMQYSAIIDSRTTDVCRFLDDRTFRIDDPDLDRLTPPNHFRCRSVLIPVTIDLPPADFISGGDVGRARDLAGRGFA